ncbi:MAG TPA: ArsO family NAD(P)H-dependent flavin-containing monooxygenase [Nocardioidaceae bacterium]|nr:ArsO family NAD(P)H-dependent flavin-containing monooxygenase [Nocardioidaceae bacterium]
MKSLDGSSFKVVVIGAGQAGVSAGFYLRRAGLTAEEYAILDANASPGGAWRHGWDSLRLFSPSEYSSLSGRPMPTWREGFPPAHHVQDYLTDYERRYDLPVHRPVTVTAVQRAGRGPVRYRLETDAGSVSTDAVISATGTWTRPFWPTYPGQRDFRGLQLHTADYRSPGPFAGQHVVVVGGGNSAAQLLAEISTVATTTWVTPRPPRFLPDDVDGRVLFDVATARATALASGAPDSGGVGGLGDIVMVPPVREARDRGVFRAVPPFRLLTDDAVVWADGRRQAADAIVWCTGFRPALAYLAPLRLTREDGHPRTRGTEAVNAPGVHLLGYGDWTGPASATLIGVGRTARDAVSHLLRPVHERADRTGILTSGHQFLET